jgi:hypothetical protein
MMNDLTLYQQAAIQSVRNRALNLRGAAQREIDAVLKRQALDRGLLDASMVAMRDGARIGLHFHPERLSLDGVSVAEGLLRTGIYTNQFVDDFRNGKCEQAGRGAREQSQTGH